MRGRAGFYLAIAIWSVVCVACICVKCKARVVDAPAEENVPVAVSESSGRIPGDDVPAREHAWPSADWEDQQDFENEKIEEALLAKATKIDSCLVTHYCVEQYKHTCNAGYPYLAANGHRPIPYATCAADDIPLGATVLVMAEDGTVAQTLRCTDRFGGHQKNHIDIAVTTHDEANQRGWYKADVYWLVED